jgi:hypothetical protein
MTTITRAITPKASFKRYTLTNVVRTAQDGYYPIGLSADRTIVYAKNGTGLHQSTDDGATWTLIYTFPGNVTGMCETKKGECLVLVNGNRIHRSTGWSANKATATWASVYSVIGERIQSNWSFKSENFGTNGVIVVNEYGAQTSAGNEAGDVGKARRVMLSEDDGKTWKVIFDISTSGIVQYGTGLHVHSSCYHEIDDRIYFTYGDGTGAAASVAGPGFMWIAYSDDRGATWKYLPAPTDYFVGVQFTTISAFETNIVLLPDGIPYGVCIIPRTGYRTLGQLRFVNQYTPAAPANVIGQDLFKAQSGPDRPLIASLSWFGTSLRNRVMISADDGSTWNEAWRSTDAAQNNGQMSLMGPTASGKVIGWEDWKNGGQWANGARFSATLTTIQA